MQKLRSAPPSAAGCAFAAVVLVGCGGKSELVPSDLYGAGGEPTDAGADAATDHVETLDGAKDSAGDAPGDGGIKPGLGLACDGVGPDPVGCQSSLTCYSGGSDPNQQNRWPGGYCTRTCSSDSQCAPYGGVCAGSEFGQGRCAIKCTAPADCRQGYACRNASLQGNKLACSPTGFVATRGPGEACFQHDDPTAAHYLAPLPHTHFGASQRVDSSGAFFSTDEIALAVDDASNVILGANAMSGMGNSNPAFFGKGPALPIAFSQSDGPQIGSAAFYSDPYLVVGNDGTFYYSTLGLDSQASQAWLVVAHSSDQGATWSSVQANPASDCAGNLGQGSQGPCMDHPWLAIGPDKLNPAGEAVYAAYLATQANDYATVVIRSVDGGKTWGIPGGPGKSLPIFSYTADNIVTNLITPSVAEDGTVHIVAVSEAGDQYGSTQNAIFYSRTEDGGATRTPPQIVNQVGKPIPFEQPVIATDSGSVYVAFVQGTSNGAWDIVLAASADGAKSWTREVVNDEPEACATHFHPALSVDRASHKLYVAWYDGRFAPYEGSVAFSVCDFSTSGTKHCSANEAIGDQTFFVTTDRSNLLFVGDYFTLVAKNGTDLWAGFADTRDGEIAQAYVARATFP